MCAAQNLIQQLCDDTTLYAIRPGLFAHSHCAMLNVSDCCRAEDTHFAMVSMHCQGIGNTCACVRLNSHQHVQQEK